MKIIYEVFALWVNFLYKRLRESCVGPPPATGVSFPQPIVGKFYVRIAKFSISGVISTVKEHFLTVNGE